MPKLRYSTSSNDLSWKPFYICDLVNPHFPERLEYIIAGDLHSAEYIIMGDLHSAAARPIHRS